MPAWRRLPLPAIGLVLIAAVVAPALSPAHTRRTPVAMRRPRSPSPGPSRPELRSVGIGPGLRPSRAHLDAATLAGLNAAVSSGPATVESLRTSLATTSILAHRTSPPASSHRPGTSGR